MGVFVAETDEKAQEIGKGFVYGGGANAFSDQSTHCLRDTTPKVRSAYSANVLVVVGSV